MQTLTIYVYSTVYAIYVTKLVRFQYSFVAIIVGMSIPITNPRQADLAARYRRGGEPPNQAKTPSRLNALVKNYLRAAPVVAQTAAANNIFNPVPPIALAGLEGRVPTGAEAGLDAGFLAAGFLPVGKAASQLNSIVNRLNKSTNLSDFMTPEAMARPASNYANQGLYRGPDSVGGFTDDNLPEPASQYLYGLVPTEKLSPLREFDRAAEPVGLNPARPRHTGPDNIERLMQHMAEGGKWSDPLAVKYFISPKLGYLAEGNHRLALAEQLGLEQLPTGIWRAERGNTPPRVGKYLGDLDVNQLALDRYSNYSNLVGERYIPPDMHPYLLKYFQP